MKERLSYSDQLDEQSIPLAKKDQLIEELRKEIEVHNCTVKTWFVPTWLIFAGLVTFNNNSFNYVAKHT